MEDALDSMWDQRLGEPDQDPIPLAQPRTTRYLKGCVTTMPMNTVARIIGDETAEALIEHARKMKDKLALPNQWVLMSPQGEMFVTDRPADLVRVLAAKNGL